MLAASWRKTERIFVGQFNCFGRQVNVKNALGYLLTRGDGK